MNNVLDMIWPLSAAVISLLAVIGIFIPILVQQKLDKCNKILLELTFYPMDLLDGVLKKNKVIKTADYFRRRFGLYKQLEESENSKECLELFEVFRILLRLSILLLLTGFWCLIFNYEHNTRWFEIGISLGLIYFVIIYGLKDIYVVFKKILLTPLSANNLPPAKELLNVENEKIPTLSFLVHSSFMHLYYDSRNAFLRLKFETCLPFYNYTISPEIIFRNKNQTEKRTTYPTVNFTEEDYEGGAIEKVYKINVGWLKTEELESLKISIRIQSKEQKYDIVSLGPVFLKDGWQDFDVYLLSWLSKQEIYRIDWHGNNDIEC